MMVCTSRASQATAESWRWSILWSFLIAVALLAVAFAVNKFFPIKGVLPWPMLAFCAMAIWFGLAYVFCFRGQQRLGLTLTGKPIEENRGGG
jgi:hypothetical protein